MATSSFQLGAVAGAVGEGGEARVSEQVRGLERSDEREKALREGREPARFELARAVRAGRVRPRARRDPSTVQTLRNLALRHVVPALGRRKLRELSAEDVDRWLADKARELSTSTVSRIKSILSRSITRAQARDKGKRNVVLLCGTPTGVGGRPSQALTLDQAQALLDAAPATTMGACVVVSLPTGAAPRS